jgi:HD-GYP domain-containing protein (c-di-GMP phosphodiesterase class II)
MQIIKIDNVKPGDVLGKSLFNKKSELLLSSGYALTEEMITLMRDKGIRFVYIMNELTTDINPEEVISSTVRQIANQKMAETFQNIESNLAFEQFAPDNIKKRLEENRKLKKIVNMPAVRKVVGQVLEDIVERQTMMFSGLQMKSADGADYEHAVDTTVLAILISRQFRYDYPEMKQLGSAAIVHDIGKMAFKEIRGKAVTELTSDEKMIIREHPIYSKIILESSDPEAFVEQAVVLQHHEQHDGSGYPQGLKGFGKAPTKERGKDAGFIHRHAEILGVANIFDNLTTGTYDGQVYPPDQAVTKLVNGEAGSWNPSVVSALVKVIQCYPVGTTVRVKDNSTKSFVGYKGVVAKANEDDQSKPTLILTHNSMGANITPKLVDFSTERYMSVELEL